MRKRTAGPSSSAERTLGEGCIARTTMRTAVAAIFASLAFGAPPKTRATMRERCGESSITARHIKSMCGNEKVML